MTDYEKHLSDLRQAYIEATPDQRLHIALQRIKHPDGGPNLLIAYVSGLEGFTRSLVIHQEARSKAELAAIYEKYRRKKLEELISEYLQKKINKKSESYFGTPIWQRVVFAISYRNLLAHECTYLGQETYPDLIAACECVLQKLAELEGLEFKI